MVYLMIDFIAASLIFPLFRFSLSPCCRYCLHLSVFMQWYYQYL